MAVDYGYPNMDAIDAMGILNEYDKEHGEDPGWARSVILEIQADIESSTNARFGTSSFDRGDYSAEELAVYDWYKNDIIAPDKWDDVVAQHHKEQGEAIGYEEPPDHTPPTDSPFVPPPTSEYTGGDNPNRELTVSTEAIDHLIKQIDAIVPAEHDGMLMKVRAKLDDAKMLPGGFAMAEIMRRKVDGTGPEDPGLRGDVFALLGTVHRALFEIRLGLAEVKREYEKAEEFNSMTSQQLDEVMEGAWGQIGNLGKYGGKEGTTTGG